MSMPITGFNLFNTALGLNSSFQAQAVNQARLGLADSAGPDMSPAQTAALAQTDKALTLFGESDKINQLAAETSQTSTKGLIQQYWKQRRQAIANGYLF